jgi:streptomycin 6-kinase
VETGSRLSACERRWRIVVRDRLSGGYRSEVFGCSTAHGREAVVKLTAMPDEAEGEAAALSAWSGSGASVRLLDVDVENGALLLERIRPGTPLPGGDDAEAVGVAAELLPRLHAAGYARFRFPALENAYARYEQRVRADADTATAGFERLDAARAAARRLCISSRTVVLLHRDFLDKNLLWNGARHVAIDPVPCLGDPCADIGFFAACHPPATGIVDRAEALATRMGEDRARAVRWAAVWAVGEACETWREDSADLQAAVSSRDLERLIGGTGAS